MDDFKLHRARLALCCKPDSDAAPWNTRDDECILICEHRQRHFSQVASSMLYFERRSLDFYGHSQDAVQPPLIRPPARDRNASLSLRYHDFEYAQISDRHNIFTRWLRFMSIPFKRAFSFSATSSLFLSRISLAEIETNFNMSDVIGLRRWIAAIVKSWSPR